MRASVTNDYMIIIFFPELSPEMKTYNKNKGFLIPCSMFMSGYSPEIHNKSNEEKMINKYLSAALLIMLIAVLTIFASGCKREKNTPVEKVVLSEDGQVQFPVSIFADGKARHYVYENDGIEVKFFILKSSDGVIRTAFDACDVCWRSGKGYEQKDDFMICRNCGMSFRSTGINVLRGGCNPAPLSSKIEGEELIISKSALNEGRGYFDFAPGGEK